MSAAQAILAMVFGTFVALDLASVPQAMFSRPLVAGFLGGLAAGHPMAGLGVGAILELFAMDTLPVGAARTPDWGPGSVAAGALASRAHLSPSELLGLVLVAVLAAWVGGGLSQLVRRANTAAVETRRAALESGDAAALRALQWTGLLRDGVRGLALTAASLIAGVLVLVLSTSSPVLPATVARIVLAATSVGVALFAGLRLSGGGGQRLWLAGGAVAGAVAAVAWLR